MSYESQMATEKNWSDYLDSTLGKNPETLAITSEEELRELDNRLLESREAESNSWYFVKSQSYIECRNVMLD